MTAAYFYSILNLRTDWGINRRRLAWELRDLCRRNNKLDTGQAWPMMVMLSAQLFCLRLPDWILDD